MSCLNLKMTAPKSSPGTPRQGRKMEPRQILVAAPPSVYNSLPAGCLFFITHTFRRLLKTHCFNQASSSP